MSGLWSRRRLLGWVAGVAASSAGMARPGWAGRPADEGSGVEVRAGLVLPGAHPASEAVRAGALFGAGEASRLAALLGSSFELEIADAATAEQAVTEARRLARPGTVAIVGGVSSACAHALAAALPDRFLEIRARGELEREAPPAAALCVTPSWAAHEETLEAVLRRRGIPRAPQRGGATRGDAAGPALSGAVAAAAPSRASAGEVAPLVAGVTLAAGPGTAVPVAWHHELRRFGAADLNERFRAATGRAMDENAWYGWIAMKIVVEATLRGTSMAEIVVDGHKGSPLRFAGGRLQQPLYVVLQRGGEPEVIDA